MNTPTEPSPANPAAWPEDATHDALIGDWKVWQRKRGHRSSVDDVVTAWMAKRANGPTPPTAYLDLGCGIGSVLLLTAYALRPGRSVGIEAQSQSALMVQRSIAELPDPPPIQVQRHDFRDLDHSFGRFSLITGSPPYFPLGTGILSPDPQRQACRFELRGGIEAYTETAARLLAPGGVFCVVFQSQWDDRVRAAGTEAGLHLRGLATFATRGSTASPFLHVYAFRHEAGPVWTEAYAVRDAEGEVTPEFQRVRASLGLSDQR